MKEALIYLVTFAAGPTAFWVLARQTPSRWIFALLWVLVIALVALAYVIPGWIGMGPKAGFIMVFVMWLAWVMVMALCTLAARARLPEGPPQQWAFAIGAIATTLPWFGLYVAQWMAE